MRRFDNTEPWQILKATNAPIFKTSVKSDAVLDEFVSELHNYCREEKDIAERTRTLNYARNELVAFCDNPVYESKKKCAYPKGD